MTTKKLSTHDRKLREVARSLKKQGYDVRADGVRGYPRPEPVGSKRRVPDIVANKGTRTRIVEIETPQSVWSDREQHKAFVRHAAQKKDTTFEVVVTVPRKSKART